METRYVEMDVAVQRNVQKHYLISYIQCVVHNIHCNHEIFRG